MVWFLPFALDWAPSSNIIQHAWITWVTRGLFVGFKRIYLGAQVDDVFLETPMYRPEGNTYRTIPADMDLHVSWQTNLNARLPKGSEFFLEMGHNGNGDIEHAVNTAQGPTACNPNEPIQHTDQPFVDPNFKKPTGTGATIWPATPSKYGWSLACAKLDPLQNWFAVAKNRDAFAHVSHTL